VTPMCGDAREARSEAQKPGRQYTNNDASIVATVMRSALRMVEGLIPVLFNR
jgi:hypothetical protein